MKKILSIIFILTLALTSVSMADSITATSLGNPTMLLKDTSIIGSYPGALQMFPNAVWAKITGAATYSFGAAYIAGDMLGFLVNYDPSSTPSTSAYNVPAGTFAGNKNITIQDHIMTAYGLKLANLYGGLMLINSFVNGTFSTKTIDSNTGDISAATIYDGVKSYLAPSAVLDMEQLKVYGTLFLNLNMTRYYNMNSHKSNSVTVRPNLLQNAGIKALAAYELNDTTKAGLTINLSESDNGHSVSSITNNVQELKTNKIDVSYNMSAILGLSIMPSKLVSLFLDLPVGLNIAPQARWAGDDIDKTVTTTLTLPSPTLGAQVQIVKNVKFRASAKSSWTHTTTTPEDIKKVSTPTATKTTMDSYSLTPALGLGVKLGKFYINAEVNATPFTDAFQTPLSVIGGLFTGGAVTFFGNVQVNYVF